MQTENIALWLFPTDLVQTIKFSLPGGKKAEFFENAAKTALSDRNIAVPLRFRPHSDRKK